MPNASWSKRLVHGFGVLLFGAVLLAFLEGFQRYPVIFFLVWLGLPVASSCLTNEEAAAEHQDLEFLRILFTGLAVGLSFFFLINGKDLLWKYFKLTLGGWGEGLAVLLVSVCGLAISSVTWVSLTEAVDRRREREKDSTPRGRS